jgi:hypothetical protein
LSTGSKDITEVSMPREIKEKKTAANQNVPVVDTEVSSMLYKPGLLFTGLFLLATYKIDRILIV